MVESVRCLNIGAIKPMQLVLLFRFMWPREVLTCRGVRAKQERQQFVYRLITKKAASHSYTEKLDYGAMYKLSRDLTSQLTSISHN